jgi:hypothetical protein
MHQGEITEAGVASAVIKMERFFDLMVGLMNRTSLAQDHDFRRKESKIPPGAGKPD